MLKKGLALLLIACLMVTMLAACNNSGSATPSPTAAPTAGATTAPTAAPTETAEPTAAIDSFPGADLKGVTIKTNNLADPAGVDESVQDIYLARQERVESKFNCKITFGALAEVTWTDVPTEVIKSVAAGDPIVDIMRPSRYYVSQFMLNDIIEDITETVLDYGLPEDYYAQCWWNNRVIGWDRLPLMPFEVMIYDRGRVMDVGMTKTPGELFMEGKWSRDDFYSYLVDLKSKLPEDVYPSGFHVLRWARLAMAADGSYLMDPKTNVPMYNTDTFYQGLEFLQKLIAEGLAKPPAITGQAEDGSNTYNWSTAAAGFPDTLVIMHGLNWNFGLELYTTMDWGIVPEPWGSNVTVNAGFTSLDNMLSSNYTTTTHDASFYVIVKGRGAGLAKATAKNYMDIVFNYEETFADHLLVNIDRVKQGLRAIDIDTGLPRNFHTEMDVELYDWYRNSRTVFNPQDSLGLANLSYSGALTLATVEGMSARTAFEAIYASDCAKMVDAGLLDTQLLDATMRAEVLKALEELRAEE